MKYGRLMNLGSEHVVTAAEAAETALEGYFTPAASELWLSNALWPSRTYTPPGGMPRQPGPPMREAEWLVEAFTCSIHTAAGLFYQGRRIYLFAYRGPGMYHRQLPGVHFSNLAVPAHIVEPQHVTNGVGVHLTMLNIACATDIIRTSILWREVIHD